jgi:hypothetical protein
MRARYPRGQHLVRALRRSQGYCGGGAQLAFGLLAVDRDQTGPLDREQLEQRPRDLVRCARR